MWLTINYMHQFKSRLTCLLVTTVLLFKLTNAFSANDIAGDIAPYGNQDGVLNTADLQVMYRFVLGSLVPTPTEIYIGDVAPLNNPDGTLNAGDLVVLQRAVLGEIVLPPLSSESTPPVLGGPLVPAITDTDVVVSHPPASDNAAVQGYEYFLDGIFAGMETLPGYTYTGLIPEQSYTLKYRAFDTGNPANLSAFSDDVIIQTTNGSDTTPPVASAIAASSSGPTEIILSEITSSSDNVAIDHQELEVSVDGINAWTLIDADVTFPYIRTVAAAGTREFYRVIAEDTSNNRTIGDVVSEKSHVNIGFEQSGYTGSDGTGIAVTINRTDAEGNNGTIPFTLSHTSGNTNYTVNGETLPAMLSIADGLDSETVTLVPVPDVDLDDSAFTISIDPASLPVGYTTLNQSSADFIVSDVTVVPSLDLTNYTLIQNHDFGITIQNETDTANQLPVVNESNGWSKTSGVAAITPNFGTAPSGTASTQVTSSPGANQWSYVSYPVTVDGVLPYDLSVEFKGYDKLEIWVVHPSSSTPVKKIIVQDLNTSNPTYQRWTMAAAGVIWREPAPESQTPDWQRAPVDLGNGWYRAMIRFQTEELGISDWSGTEIRLYHNRLQTEQPVEYGLVSFGKHQLAQLYKHYATRFPFDLGYGDTINNEWERYRDNGNHVITANNLQLIANLITFTNGGIESGIIAGRLRMFRGESFIVEVRGKLASGSGSWGALSWLIESASLPGFPRIPPNPEIDMIEAVDGDQPNQGESVFTTHSTINNGIVGDTEYSIMDDPFDQYGQNKFTPVPPEDWSADFHTWTVEVTQTHVTFFKDGTALKKVQYDSNSALGFETRSNQAIGGNWPGDPTDPGIFPLTLEIDYEKIWRSSENLAVISAPVDHSNVPLNDLRTSAPITVSGFTGNKIVQVSPGATFTVNNGAYSADPKTVIDGDEITIRRQSPTINNHTFTTTLSVGTKTAQWAITTLP